MKMVYKCVQCNFTFESKTKNILTKAARDHLFLYEHAGFVRLTEREIKK